MRRRGELTLSMDKSRVWSPGVPSPRGWLIALSWPAALHLPLRQPSQPYSFMPPRTLHPPVIDFSYSASQAPC